MILGRLGFLVAHLLNGDKKTQQSTYGENGNIEVIQPTKCECIIVKE